MKLSFYFSFALIFASNAFAAESLWTPPRVETYDELVHEVRAAIRTTKERVEEAVEREKVREAWEIGKLIDTHVLHYKERADYGKYVIERLARDLGMSRTELYYMLEFARTYPIVRPAGQLSWAHYQALLSLNEPKERKEVAEEAVRQSWTRDRLRAEVQRRQAARRPSQKNVPEPILTATPGKVGVYRVIRAKAGPFPGKLALDLGFASYYRPKEIQKFKEGDIVSIAGAGFPRPVLKGAATAPLQLSKDATPSDLFTYRAYVSEIIDGDTFKAVIDLGFDIVTEQKLRLRGLDAPEIESKEGKEAKEFLASVIASGAKPAYRTGRQSPVLIRTVKSDKYDRYLADVFVKDRYVNQELVAQGLAVVVEE